MLKKKPQLVLIRHGESQWNLENRFTGWVDVPLSERGEAEARSAALLIKAIRFDVAYTSVLKRAVDTLHIILKIIGQEDIPIHRDPALNERHYGDLQGLNKAETAKKFGEQKVRLWRRSYDMAPPHGESLKDTAERTLPYFKEKILRDLLKEGKNVLVSAHGNSLRSIVMHLDGLTPDEVVKLEMGTGVPYVYTFDSEGKITEKKILT